MIVQNPYARFAEFYDAYVGDYDQDISLYLELASDCSSRILEIGCGSGRILLPLLKAGYQVTGVDISDEMLLLASKKIKKESLPGDCVLLNHNLVSGSLKPEYGLGLITFYTFNYLLARDDQKKFLQHVAESLLPGSKIALHLFYPGPLLHPETDGKWTDKGKFRVGNQKVLLRDLRHMIDDQIEERIQAFEYESGQREEIRTLRRLVTKDDLLSLLLSTGFKEPFLVNHFNIKEQTDLTPKLVTESDFVVIAKRL